MRRVLKPDALVTGANGLACAAAVGLLDEPLGVDAAPQRLIGAFLMLFAAGVSLGCSSSFRTISEG